MTDYTVGDTVNFMFTTRRFSTGAPYALAGTPVISAYEDNSTTQITDGITLTADFDTVTGLNHVAVVASGANGFESGKDYHLVITTGTVDSVSVVGEVVGRFTLGRSAAAVDLANGTDGLGAIKTDTAAILVDTGTTLDGRIPAALVSGRMDVSVGAMAANTLTASALATDAVNEIVDQVWDEAQADHVTAGSFGITASEIADILVDTAEIGAAGAGLTNINLPNQTMDITGNITGNLSGSVGSVTGAVGSVTGAIGSVGAGGIAASTFAAGAVDAAALATDAVNEIADGILNRDLSTGTDSGSPTVRTMRQALRFLRNKWSISGTTLTVTKEDDTTASWTAALTGTAGADPITASDPAS